MTLAHPRTSLGGDDGCESHSRSKLVYNLEALKAVPKAPCQMRDINSKIRGECLGLKQAQLVKMRSQRFSNQRVGCLLVENLV